MPGHESDVLEGNSSKKTSCYVSRSARGLKVMSLTSKPSSNASLFLAAKHSESDTVSDPPRIPVSITVLENTLVHGVGLPAVTSW